MFARFLECKQDIFGISARADSKKHITFVCQGFDLSCKDDIKAIVIANGCERRRIGAKGDCCYAMSFFLVAPCELGGNVLRICCAPSIAANQELIAFAKGLEQNRKRIV